MACDRIRAIDFRGSEKMIESIIMKAKGQALESSRVIVASGLVNEIECRFETDWNVDELRAVFYNKSRNERYSVVLNVESGGAITFAQDELKLPIPSRIGHQEKMVADDFPTIISSIKR